MVGGIEGGLDVVDDNLSAPEHAKGDGQKDADQEVSPEGFESESQAMNDDVAAKEGHAAVGTREPDEPSPEGLGGDDGGVDGDDPREHVAEEFEEVDVGHGVKRGRG